MAGIDDIIIINIKLLYRFPENFIVFPGGVSFIPSVQTRLFPAGAKTFIEPNRGDAE